MTRMHSWLLCSCKDSASYRASIREVNILSGYHSITADSDDLCISVGETEDVQWRESCKGGKQETINQWEGQMIVIEKGVEEKKKMEITTDFLSYI